MAFPNIRRGIELLYDGVCDIYILKDVQGEDYLTHKEPIMIYKSVPCRLSHSKSASAYGRNPVGEIKDAGYIAVEGEVRLFLPPEPVIPEGCRFTVTQYGITKDYERSGSPRFYLNHQEIPVELFKDKA